MTASIAQVDARAQSVRGIAKWNGAIHVNRGAPTNAASSKWYNGPSRPTRPWSRMRCVRTSREANLRRPELNLQPSPISTPLVAVETTRPGPLLGPSFLLSYNIWEAPSTTFFTPMTTYGVISTILPCLDEIIGSPMARVIRRVALLYKPRKVNLWHWELWDDDTKFIIWPTILLLQRLEDSVLYSGQIEENKSAGLCSA